MFSGYVQLACGVHYESIIGRSQRQICDVAGSVQQVEIRCHDISFVFLKTRVIQAMRCCC